jgi:hypothetical protein
VSALAVGRGPLLGQVKPANVDAADAIYQGVTARLRSWTLWLVLIMAVVMVVTLLWGRIGIIPAIERGYRAVSSQAARSARSARPPGPCVPPQLRRVPT